MRPRIALTLSRSDTPARRAARRRYITALDRAGAEVIPIEPGDPLPDAFDGLCLSGGGDIDPARYAAVADPETRGVDQERDATEFAILATALTADVPVLGICRGFQVLNVAFGGTLIQHLDGHEADACAVHQIAPLPDTLLAKVSDQAPFTVNSRHHQAVTDGELAPGLRASAYVDDLVEGLEAPRHRFVVGVQWHPERTDEVAPAATRVFTAFVEAAALIPTR